MYDGTEMRQCFQSCSVLAMDIGCSLWVDCCSDDSATHLMLWKYSNSRASTDVVSPWYVTLPRLVTQWTQGDSTYLRLVLLCSHWLRYPPLSKGDSIATESQCLWFLIDCCYNGKKHVEIRLWLMLDEATVADSYFCCNSAFIPNRSFLLMSTVSLDNEAMWL